MDESKDQALGTTESAGETLSFVEGTPGAAATGIAEDSDPQFIGRYRIVKRLGKGGFGRVYLAIDDDLDRRVAIKVPNPERITKPEDVETYLNEARTLASLDHPNIVPVHDVGRTERGLCFIVSKYIEGSDLQARIREKRPGFREAAELIAVVAEALHYAHTRGLVHRDIKPANLLIDSAGKPCIADFGLALKAEQFGEGTGCAGTPSYMSPEQARGEGHRVDGRSDIFSLGVVFYELLTGRRPFSSPITQELFELIVSTEPRPPRQINDAIPRELERICLKALAKRAAERYTTARDMAEDLRHCLGQAAWPAASDMTTTPGTPLTTTQEPALESTVPSMPTAERARVTIVPKGLRSFDEEDSDFFLELLPGPRDREGLPEILRFWKSRIEETDSDKTFPVGLIYGPSGCGKSSLIKAGLLPRLKGHVLAVHIEATPYETENRLLKGLRKVCPGLPPQAGLVESLAAIRIGGVLHPGQKLLLVLDQFEQWLHAHRGEEKTELVAALRQCDGEHLQAVVMVRDDFWLAVSRFMVDLEIDLIQGQNTALVDLFDLQHARKVLASFGAAYGTIPARPADISRDQHAFLDQAIQGLAQDGKVISVRLALFADMVKGKPWTPKTLRAMGGTAGVGVTFLEETFCSLHANPRHRVHRKAAPAVLRAFLPETGTDFRGLMRSEQELQKASGYAEGSRDFRDLMHLLDNELRLITPTEPENVTSEQPAGDREGHYYQLTHDYLVRSLRNWLTQKQRETRRGRAELRLDDRSALWNSKPENRLLPSLIDWAGILLLTRRKDWTGPQRTMLTHASLVHGRRILTAVMLLGLLTWGCVEGYCSFRADDLVESLRTAGTADVPAVLRQLEHYRRWVNPRLRKMVQSGDDSSRDKLHASLALLPVDRDQLPFLERHLLVATPTEFTALRDSLRPYRQGLTPRLWSVLDAAGPGETCLLPVASALADYDPRSPHWQSVGGKVAQALVSVNPVYLGPCLNALRPVRGTLSSFLVPIFRDRTRPATERTLATSILTDYANDDPVLLADLLLDAEPEAFSELLPLARQHETITLPLFRAELRKISPVQLGRESPAPTEEHEWQARRKAIAAIALLRLGAPEPAWPLLAASPDPRVRALLIDQMIRYGVGPELLGERLGELPDPVSRQGILLALADLSPAQVPTTLADQVALLFSTDPSPAVHAGAEFLLRRWGQDARLAPLSAPLAGSAHAGWSVNSQGQTMVLVPGPVTFRMGPPVGQTNIHDDEKPHVRRIGRTFAVASHEVTVAQFLKFRQDLPYNRQISPDLDGPIINVSWYEAIKYCRWLSEQEKVPEDQMCYPPVEKIGPGMNFPHNPLECTGYRLPTEAEWEYICAAGTSTQWCFGDSDDLLPRYAWFVNNSLVRVHPVGRMRPNPFGFFDLNGNASEWCQTPHTPYPDTTSGQVVEDDDFGSLSGVDVRREVRGGHYREVASFTRTSARADVEARSHYSYTGFRVARTVSP